MSGDAERISTVNAQVQEITENMGFCGQMGALIANLAAFASRS